MSTHNICFRGEIKRYQHFWMKKAPYMLLCRLSCHNMKLCTSFWIFGRIIYKEILPKNFHLQILCLLLDLYEFAGFLAMT